MAGEARTNLRLPQLALVLALLCLTGATAGATSGGDSSSKYSSHSRRDGGPSQFANDAYNLQVALNLEFLEAEFFLWAVYGYGLDKVAPYLVQGGPPPKGAQKANLDEAVKDVILQFGLQEVGHLRSVLTDQCASGHLRLEHL